MTFAVRKDKTKVESKTHPLSLGAYTARIAAISKGGVDPNKKRKKNQDAYYISTTCLPDRKQSNFSVCGVCDGHGKQGRKISDFISKKLPRAMRYEHNRCWESPTKNPVEKAQAIKKACFDAHVKCSKSLDLNPFTPSRTSGSTSVSVCFWEDYMTICNVGDSRAVLGEFSSGEDKILANALSRDQTPYRKDERDRVIECGARALNMGQVRGQAKVHDNWNDEHVGVHLEKIHEDAPRIWAKDHLFPGCQFTRSFGDFALADLGIHSQPEILTRKISANDRYLVLASDGVWEFLTNQDVIDICSGFSDPKDACDAIVELSSKLWLQNGHRTDDTTIVCIYLNDAEPNDSQPKLLDIASKRIIVQHNEVSDTSSGSSYDSL